MDLSVVVVSWNTRTLLAQCLQSVYAHPPACAFDVWVVDNASQDGSAALVCEQFPQAHLIRNPRNVGFARANNQAVRASTGRYVLLLNSDTIVRRDALDRMLAFAEAHPGAGIVGASLLNADGTPQWCYGPFPSLVSETLSACGLNTRGPLARWFGPAQQHPDVVTNVGWVLGAALLVRRAALDKVGLLDEAYFMYSEEVDLALRVSRAGWTNSVVGTAQITHLGQQSTDQMPALMKAELFRSKVCYFRKHHGRLSARWLQSVFGLSIRARLYYYQVRRRREQVRLWKETGEYFSSRELSESKLRALGYVE